MSFAKWLVGDKPIEKGKVGNLLDLDLRPGMFVKALQSANGPFYFTEGGIYPVTKWFSVEVNGVTKGNWGLVPILFEIVEQDPIEDF